MGKGAERCVKCCDKYCVKHEASEPLEDLDPLIQALWSGKNVFSKSPLWDLWIVIEPCQHPGPGPGGCLVPARRRPEAGPPVPLWPL